MNILLITSDEHRFDAAGCNGNSIIKTPNLDRLAREGMNFLNHRCTAPVCTPARASILTGQYSCTHGAWDVGYTLDKSKEGLAHWLSKSGYSCGIFGKSHFEPEMSNHAANMDHSKPYYGFDEFHITEDNPVGEYIDWINENYPEFYDKVAKTFHEDLQNPRLPMFERGRFRSVFTSPAPEHLHQTAWITDRAIDFIKEKGRTGRPFFAWTSFVDPHHPWIPPEPFASMYDPSDMPVPKIKEGECEGLNAGYNYPLDMPSEEYQRMCAAYYGMISHIDFHIGRLIDTLKEMELYDETIIIFTSDHGDYNGDHGLIRKNPWMFESILKVPLIIRYPETGKKGAVFHGDTIHEDLAPTLLDLLGIPIPMSIQGESFAEVIKRGEGESRKYSYFYYMGRVGIKKGRYKLLYYPRRLWPGRGELCKESDGSFRLLAYPEKSGGFVLTDLEEDPLEYNNLSGEESCSEVEKELKEELFKWLLNLPMYYPPRLYW